MNTKGDGGSPGGAGLPGAADFYQAEHLLLGAKSGELTAPRFDWQSLKRRGASGQTIPKSLGQAASERKETWTFIMPMHMPPCIRKLR